MATFDEMVSSLADGAARATGFILAWLALAVCGLVFSLASCQTHNVQPTPAPARAVYCLLPSSDEGYVIDAGAALMEQAPRVPCAYGGTVSLEQARALDSLPNGAGWAPACQPSMAAGGCFTICIAIDPTRGAYPSSCDEAGARRLVYGAVMGERMLTPDTALDYGVPYTGLWLSTDGARYRVYAF